MTGPKMAETITATGPDDKLIVVDVYQEEGSAVVNSYQETHPEAIDVLDTAKGKPQGGSEESSDDPLGDFIDKFTGDDSAGANNDISDLTDLDASTDYGLDSIEELAASNDELLSDITDLSDPLKGALAIPGQVVPEIYAQTGDMLNRLRAGISTQSLGALTNIVNQLSNGQFPTTILNSTGIGTLVAGVTSAASRIGIPNTFSAIASGINNQSAMDIALRTVLPEVVRKANIPLLNDIANTPLVRSVQNLIPGIVGETVRGLTRPTYLGQNEYAGYYGASRQTFGRIDSNWNSDVRYENGTVLNGTVVGSNPFYYDTAQASVMNYPITVKPNPNSGMDQNPAVVEYGDVYVNSTPLVGESQEVFEGRVVREQIEDRAMVVAGSLLQTFGQRTVGDYLDREFGTVGAVVNRTMFA